MQKGLQCQLSKYRATYRAQNREKILAQQREYYATHREKISEQQKKYYDTHREQILKRKKMAYQNRKRKQNDFNRMDVKHNIGFDTIQNNPIAIPG